MHHISDEQRRIRLGQPVWRLLSDIGRDATAMVEAEASRLSQRVGQARITPRFRTSLERELTA